MKRKKLNHIIIEDYKINKGDLLTCSNPGYSKLTKNKKYLVLNTFTYINQYKNEKYNDYFVIIKNDNGFKIKVNIKRFDILNHIKSFNRIKSIDSILEMINENDT